MPFRRRRRKKSFHSCLYYCLLDLSLWRCTHILRLLFYQKGFQFIGLLIQFIYLYFPSQIHTTCSVDDTMEPNLMEKCQTVNVHIMMLSNIIYDDRLEEQKRIYLLQKHIGQRKMYNFESFRLKKEARVWVFLSSVRVCALLSWATSGSLGRCWMTNDPVIGSTLFNLFHAT